MYSNNDNIMCKEHIICLYVLQLYRCLCCCVQVDTYFEVTNNPYVRLDYGQCKYCISLYISMHLSLYNKDLLLLLLFVKRFVHPV